MGILQDFGPQGGVETPNEDPVKLAEGDKLTLSMSEPKWEDDGSVSVKILPDFISDIKVGDDIFG